MKTLLAFPSTASFAQQAALAFHERGMLAAFMTAYVHDDAGAIAKLLSKMPTQVRERIEPQLRRRAITMLPPSVLDERPFWEIVRTLADKSGASAPIVDRVWDRLSRAFTRAAGQRLNRGDVGAVYAYEYTALEAFEAAERRGVAKVLDFPSLNSREFENLQRIEKTKFPELVGPHDAYFAKRFEERQARRDAEMRGADVIITNSSVTRRSHIAGGADPDKTFAVPYGAPPAVASLSPRSTSAPLRVIWAGTFSIRKGAHYFIDAWRALAAGADAHADIYGAISLPERLWKPVPQGMTFHGSVPRNVLFEAYDNADILVFPTLSDGFGMVVTEAFARGVPVITTDQAGASDLVVHERNGLIVPAGDPFALREAMRWCLQNRAAVSAMRSDALQTARTWQWSDYRHALIEAVQAGLVRAGFEPTRDVITKVE